MSVCVMLMVATRVAQLYGESVAVFPWQHFQYFITLLTASYVRQQCKGKGIVALYWQQWLRKRTTILRHTFIVYIV